VMPGECPEAVFAGDLGDHSWFASGARAAGRPHTSSHPM
jgi:hypothetical protein